MMWARVWTMMKTGSTPRKARVILADGYRTMLANGCRPGRIGRLRMKIWKNTADQQDGAQYEDAAASSCPPPPKKKPPGEAVAAIDLLRSPEVVRRVGDKVRSRAGSSEELRRIFVESARNAWERTAGDGSSQRPGGVSVIGDAMELTNVVNSTSPPSSCRRLRPRKALTISTKSRR